MRRGQPLGHDSYEFQTAVARANSAPAPSAHQNLALLSDAATLERLRGLFAQYDAGSLPLDAFRARMAALGLCETPEASRVLQQLPLAFTALQRALKSGNEALAAPDARFGAASRADVAGPYHTSRLSNILIDSRAGPTLKGREDVGAAAQESGAGALLRGQGGALPPGATQREPGERAALSERTQHARVTHPSALVEAGAGALLRGEGAALHPRAADGAWERARQVLVLVDGGALRRGDAEARLGELGLTPANAPGLAAALKGYYDAGRLDVRAAMAAVSEALREAAAAGGGGASGAGASFTRDAEVAPLTAGGRRGPQYKNELSGDIFGGASAPAPTHARAIAPEGAALRARILGGSPEPRALIAAPVLRQMGAWGDAVREGAAAAGGGGTSNEAQWATLPAAVARSVAQGVGVRGGTSDPARARALGSSNGAPAPFHTSEAAAGDGWGRGLGGPQLPGAARARDKREMGGKAVEGHWETWRAPDLSK
jgi:hypothetical protein